MDKELKDENLEGVVKNMSQINPDAVKIHAQTDSKQDTPPKSPAEKFTSINVKDKRGRAFDPAIHEIDENGNPKLNRDGLLSIRAGRPSAKSETSGNIETDPVLKTRANSAKLAKLATNTFFRLGYAIGGEEWLPIKTQEYDEESDLNSLFADYFNAKGLIELTPGWALLAGVGTYAGIRATQPKTQSGLKSLWSKSVFVAKKVMSGISGFFKKLFKGGNLGAHVDLGSLRDGQNNTGKETGQNVQG